MAAPEVNARMGAVTELLIAHRDGRADAFDRLVELVYQELRRVARAQLRRYEVPGPLLETTGLVHETYLKLVDQSRLTAADRGHFLAIAARAMRQVIVDYARTQQAAKRGGGAPHVPIDDRDAAVLHGADQVLGVHQALDRLAAEDRRLLQVVECRFFAGLSEAETADALAVSPRTVERDWMRAKAWLREALDGGARPGDPPAG